MLEWYGSARSDLKALVVLLQVQGKPTCFATWTHLCVNLHSNLEDHGLRVACASPQGVVLESTFDASKGNLATLLVQRGTLKRGDYTVSGTKFGRVRAMDTWLFWHVWAARLEIQHPCVGVSGTLCAICLTV